MHESDWLPFSDLAQVNPRPSVSGNIIPYVGMEDVSNDGQLLRLLRRDTDSIGGSQPSFEDHDVLFAKITPCMENGKGAYVEGLNGVVARGSTEFHVLRARTGVEAKFIYHLTMMRGFRRKAESMMTGTGGQRRVPAEFFSTFRVRRLPLSKQKQISALLDSAVDSENSIRASIRKLDLIKQGTISDLMKSPRFNWKSGTIRDLGDVTTGTTPPNEWDSQSHQGSIPLITPTQVSEIGEVVTYSRMIDIRRRSHVRLIPSKSTLAVCIGFGMGKVALSEVECCTNQQINSVTPFGNMDPRFVYLAVDRAMRRAQGIANLQVTPIINKSQFSRLPVDIPEEWEQRKIADASWSVHELQQHLSSELAKIRLARLALSDSLIASRAITCPQLNHSPLNA